MITMMDSGKKLVKVTYYCVWCGVPYDPRTSPKDDLAHVRDCVLPNLERMAAPYRPV